MIKYFDGTVFNVDTQAVVNTVNCMGVMQAGIALEFMLRYPKMFEDYAKKCEEKKITVGQVDYYKCSDSDYTIVNFPTKWHFKYPSKLSWIEEGLKNFVLTYKQNGIKSIAFPKLGTYNGGLDWNDVKRIMEKHLAPLDIDVYICLDDKAEAEGIEKKMLDAFNSTRLDEISQIVKLNMKQKEKIMDNMPYNRFWKISKTESIGIKTYSAIFKYYYKKATSNGSEDEQLMITGL